MYADGTTEMYGLTKKKGLIGVIWCNLYKTIRTISSTVN
jgi:hypothetical protein